MLHLIFQLQSDSAVLNRMASGDVAVLLNNAVLSTLQNGKMAETLTEKLNSNRLYVLSEDMAIRGILAAELVTGLEIIDYAGLVNLTIQNTLIASWC
jgi:tRNA 2-thiouridine synthesizing protein B